MPQGIAKLKNLLERLTGDAHPHWPWLRQAFPHKAGGEKDHGEGYEHKLSTPQKG